MIFFRQLQHLLPDAAAWRAAVGTKLRRLLEGLAGAPTDARTYIDQVYGDWHPETTRELAEWESLFGIPSTGSEAARRLQLAGAWSAQGGQSPRYLQDVLHAAGFVTVFVHEWWEPGTQPRVVRDPRSHTVQPLVGTVQCGEPMAQCTPGGVVNGVPVNIPQLPDPPPPHHDPDSYPPVCNRWLNNEVGYLVNLDLTRNAPPPVPADPARWRFFLYFGGQSFGERAEVPAARRAEFEMLLLKICPAQQWLVTKVDYV